MILHVQIAGEQKYSNKNLAKLKILVKIIALIETVTQKER